MVGCTHEATRDATVEIALPPEGLKPMFSRHVSIESPTIGAAKPARWAHFGVTKVPKIPLTHFANASASWGQMEFRSPCNDGH